MTAKNPRIRWTVTYRKRHGLWRITRDGALFQYKRLKADALWMAVDTCRAELRIGILSELVIKGRDGKIKDSRTYGKDPRRIKG